VDANGREVDAEARLHVSAGGAVKRPAGRRKDPFDAVRQRIGVERGGHPGHLRTTSGNYTIGRAIRLAFVPVVVGRLR